jgi:uncharacterized protein DUF3558
MSWRFASLSAALCLGLAAACGGGGEASKSSAVSAGSRPEPAKPAPKLDACSLLTAEEIEAAVGWKSAKAEPSSYGGTAVCNFSGPKGVSQSLSLLVAPGMPNVASSTEMAQWRRQQTKGYGDIKFIIEPVEGLGVPAIRNEVGEVPGMATIEAAANGVLLDVTSSTMEEAKVLAAKAIKRLP